MRRRRTSGRKKMMIGPQDPTLTLPLSRGGNSGSFFLVGGGNSVSFPLVRGE